MKLVERNTDDGLVVWSVNKTNLVLAGFILGLGWFGSEFIFDVIHVMIRNI